MSDETADEPIEEIIEETLEERLEQETEDAKGKKKKKKPEPDEIDTALAESSVQKEKKKVRKKQIKYGVIIVAVVSLVLFVQQLLVPYKGTMAFGICRVFLELNLRYPHTLKLSTVQERGTSVRIWFTQVDSFGEYRLEPIECYFKSDETYGFILDKVTLKRRELDPVLIQNFNRALPVIFAHPPDLTLPWGLPDNIDDLQFETDRFRRPIL